MSTSRTRRAPRRTHCRFGLTRLLTTAVLAVAGIGAVGAGVPEANSAPNGNIVTFGDSYTSNPDELRNTLKKVPIPDVHHFVWGTYPSRLGCLQAPNNWPRQLGSIARAPIADYSCTAESSHVIPGKIDKAIAAGDIHRGTRAIVIAVGINDFGPYGIQRGAQPLSAGKMRNDYINNIRRGAAKARAAAPNAKILLSGSLSITEPDRLNSLCFINVVPDAPLGIPMSALHQIEHTNRSHQRAAAAASGATYVEMMHPSRHHSTCARDSQRWVAGVIDPHAQHNMGLHPTPAGSRFMAKEISRHL
ncbi:GDSL-type esterase/lipase family protein [uncultured Corynebacterium sp.]|uniref:GDSL-type esterase/lipase family protein n=1 Tax=uncultured Corynebacterium sp. TaxID=159447 RepID=UPI0025EED6DB|nr:GDSL-type esterase/lipase family protein [uncultured Corynebacterium sp.]